MSPQSCEEFMGGKAEHFPPIISEAPRINSWDSVDKLLIPVNKKEKNKN